MARSESAGILPWRLAPDGTTEVFLVHPGGPFWSTKDAGAWSIPKGELAAGESPEDAAVREFVEETGVAFPAAWRASLVSLTSRRQRAGKMVHAFALRWPHERPLAIIASNKFTLQWPPRSGRRMEFPELDRGEWLPLAVAAVKINDGQRPFLEDVASLAQGQGPRGDA